nr:unnamed protein product [Callosobruchus analis]
MLMTHKLTYLFFLMKHLKLFVA